MGNLYIVATPIGNLQDITFRALETLEKADYIACEDTRSTSVLIRHFFKQKEKEMFAKMFSYYEQTETQKIPHLITLLEQDKNIALVSDAGTPAISDPGFKLIRECVSKGIKVISIPGASSVVSALVSSGLPTDKFTFLGFLPQKPGHRKTFLENIKKSQEFVSSTIVIFESPYKLLRSLEDMKLVFGNIVITVARELTKIYEEVKKDNLDNLIEKYKKSKPKGEIVILFNLK